MPEYIDKWIAAHVISWVLIAGWLSWFLDGRYPKVIIVTTLIGTILWEIIEFGRERILEHTPETLVDRAVIDPISNVIGAAIGYFVMTRFVL